MEEDAREKRKLALPIIGLLLFALGVGILIYPVISASPKDIPLAILSLDEGTQTPQGEINIGNTLVDEVAGSSEEGSPIVWTKFEEHSDLEAAMEADEFYAAITIPKDFTASNIAVQMGEGEAAAIAVTINQEKNPAIAETVEATVKDMLADNDNSAEIHYINPVPDGRGEGIIARQVSYILTMVLSIVCSILLYRTVKYKGSENRVQRGIKVAIGIGYAAILALCLGWFVAFYLTAIAGLALPFANTLLFVAMASFSMMAVFVGSFSWNRILGVSVLLVVVVCGLTTALLPYELLPVFWQDWLYPWVPERFIAEGLHQILYADAGIGNSASVALAGIGAGGVAVWLASLFKPSLVNPESALVA